MWDFVCRQPPEQAECQRNARLRRENRVAGDEYQPQEVVADVMVERGFEIWHGHHLLGLEFAAKLLVLGLKPLVAAEHVDRAVLRGSHEPGAWVVWDARLRPLLTRDPATSFPSSLAKTPLPPI